MITEAEFWRAQEILGKHGKPRPKHCTFAFTGMIRCGECGCSVTAEEKVNRYGYHYTYYHCTKKKVGVSCSQPSIELKELEHQINTDLSHIKISERFKEWALKHLNEVNDREIEDRQTIYVSLQKAYSSVQRQLDELIKLRLRGLILDEEYLRQKTELHKERAGLEERLRDTEHRADRWLELAEKTFEFACYAQEWFSKGPLEDKRTILEILGSNLILKDKKLIIEAQKPFIMIREGLEALKAEPARLEPLKMPVNIEEIEQIYAQSPIGLPVLNKIRTFFKENPDADF